MCFFKRAIKASGTPDTVVIDGSNTNKGVLHALNKNRKNNPIIISMDKFLNNRIEQDHRKVKRKMKMSLSFKTMRGAKAIIAGVEILHMIYKNQSGYLPLLSENPLQAFWKLALI